MGTERLLSITWESPGFAEFTSGHGTSEDVRLCVNACVRSFPFEWKAKILREIEEILNEYEFMSEDND